MPARRYNSITRTAKLWHCAWQSVKAWCVAGRILGVIFENGRYLIPTRARRSSVRPITAAQRAEIKRRQMAGRAVASSSGYRGVYRRKTRWVAAIAVDGRPVHIGSYGTPEEAARAWDRRARELRGEGAWVNFPDEQ
jgi:hypothetical protein